jgi:hypothetical protein
MRSMTDIRPGKIADTPFREHAIKKQPNQEEINFVDQN